MSKFPITFSELSVWELAHHLCDKDPYPFIWRPIHKDVKQAIRSLLYEIYSNRLDSSLIYTKREHDKNPANPEHYLRTHLGSMWACISGDHYPRELFKFIHIDRYSFKNWCTKSKLELPRFWFAADFSWENDHYEAEQAWDEKLEKFSKDPQNDKREKARFIAIKIWDSNPQVPVLTIARSEKMKIAIPHTQPDTIRKWIEPLLPESHIKKRGRPPALDSETEQLLKADEKD